MVKSMEVNVSKELYDEFTRIFGEENFEDILRKVLAIIKNKDRVFSYTPGKKLDPETFKRIRRELKEGSVLRY